MAKDPAFLFYSQDFIVGTIVMSFEDRGKYITILSMMHQQGRMKEETICLLVGSVSVILKSKFKVDENGLWYNERLEIETEKRRKYSNSRKTNGLLGGRPKAYGKATDNHTEDAIVNEIMVEIGSEKIKEIANEVWKDAGWKEAICMGLSIQIPELQKWLALFNSSISNEKIHDFDKAKYKKMSRGWISTQQSKGVAVGTVKKSESAPLERLNNGN